MNRLKAIKTDAGHPAEKFCTSALAFYPDLPNRLQVFLIVEHFVSQCDEVLEKSLVLVDACNQVCVTVVVCFKPCMNVCVCR